MLCITDHNAIKGAVELVDRLPCRVIVGEELRTHAGEIIGLFLTERIPIGVPPADAARAIREQGGIVYIPHPFDPMRRNLAEPALDALIGDGLVDAIEVINAKTSLRSLNERGRRRRPRRTASPPGRAATPTCPTRSARPTSRCPTSTVRTTSSPSCAAAARSATTGTSPARGRREFFPAPPAD